MADPVTLAIGAVAVGTAFKAAGDIKQAKTEANAVRSQAQDTLQQAELTEQSALGVDAEAQAAEYNAGIADQNAVLTRQQYAEQERRYRDQSRLELGEIVARYGASGVTLDGSPMDVLEASARNAELNALTLRHEGEVKALAYTNDAALSRYQANVARSNAATVRSNAEYIRSKAGRIDASADDVETAGVYNAIGTGLQGAGSLLGKVPASPAPKMSGSKGLLSETPTTGRTGVTPPKTPSFTGKNR